MLFLDRETVEALLNLDQLVDALAGAMAELSAGSVSMPPRVAASVEQQNGLLGVMPVYLASSQTLAAKLVSIFPQNAALNVPTHQAIIAVFDALTGSCLAIMDGTYITAARTAAGSALATRLLARADADILAVIGAGVQARMHALIIPRVRPIQEIRIVGRTPEKAQSLAQQLSQELGIVAKAVGSFSEAAAGPVSSAPPRTRRIRSSSESIWRPASTSTPSASIPRAVR